MQGSSSTQPNASPGPLLKGTPGFIGYFENIVENYHAAISDAIDRVVQEEQDSIQNAALQEDSGWSTFSDKLRVQYDNEERTLKYSVSAQSPEEAYKAQVLEFGDEASPASPLLRKTAARNKDSFDSRVLTHAYSTLNKSVK